MRHFKFTGYKIYTLAWKDYSQQSELTRDYLSTRVGNSELLHHLNYKNLDRVAKIFSVIKPSLGFKLATLEELCKANPNLNLEKEIKK